MAPCNDPAAVFLAGWLAETAGANPDLKLRALQRLFRGIDYHSDGSVDLWAPPLEVFRDRRGDCEDVAIAKYVLLRLLGFPEDSLLLLVVWDRKRDLSHALLAVDVGSSTWFLDNGSEPPSRHLSSGYLPLYGLNSEDRWVFADAD
jgi:predicted transglutaminase-like cysteine proteinase